MIGKIISHYKIVEKLGEVGMGVVYKGGHEARPPIPEFPLESTVSMAKGTCPVTDGGNVRSSSTASTATTPNRTTHLGL